MSLRPIPGYSPNRQDYIDDPDKFNNPMLGGLGGSMRRSDDVYNRGQAPVEMPMPPAPMPTQVYELPQDIQRPSRGGDYDYVIGGDLGVGPRRPDEGLDLAKLLGLGGNPNEVYGITVGEGVPGTSDGLPLPPQMPDTQQQAGGASFESDYIDWMESKPTQPRRPRGMGAASKKYQKANREYKENLKQWEASKPSRAMYSTAPVTTAPTEPAPPEFMPPPTETPDKFEGRYVPPTSNLGTPDSLIPSNIVGQSYDPGFAARFLAGGTGETNVDAGNGIGMMVMPQRPEPPVGSVFGGYGQQAPMQALAPYAGMAQSQPMPTDFFPTYIPRPDPIYETVPRPETNQPAPQPNAQPVMSSNIPGAIPGNTPGVDFNVFENPMGSYVR